MTTKALNVAALFPVLLVASTAACSSYQKDAVTTIIPCETSPSTPGGCNTPRFDEFKAPSGVGDFMLQRCGSLDCHGQVGRPLRLYGKDALRLEPDGGNFNYLNPTSQDEYQASFDAVVALQPEDMIRVMTADHQDPNTLLLLLKPTNSLVHKGGAVISAAPPDPGFKCLVNWLTYDAYDGQGTTGDCPQAILKFP